MPDLQDDFGNQLTAGSTGADASGGFGAAAARYIGSGVLNGDFALTPEYTTVPIDDDTNPLPYWSFVQVSGIVGYAISTAEGASGHVLDLRLPAGAAGDECYVEQIVRVNGAWGQSYAYFPTFTVANIGAANLTEVYITAQYLLNDGVTTSGPAATTAMTATAITALGYTPDLEAAPNTTGILTSFGYYLRIRIGARRAGGAATDAGAFRLYEVRNLSGGTKLVVADGRATAGPLTLTQTGGTATLTPGGAAPIFGIASALTVSGTRTATPLATQTLVAASAILATAEVVPIDSAGNIVLTSVPHIAGGVHGQMLTVLNVGAFTITLSDQGTLGGSNLRLSAATIVLGPRDSLQLVYFVGAIFDWLQVGQTNVI